MSDDTKISESKSQAKKLAVQTAMSWDPLVRQGLVDTERHLAHLEDKVFLVTAYTRDPVAYVQMLRTECAGMEQILRGLCGVVEVADRVAVIINRLGRVEELVNALADEISE